MIGIMVVGTGHTIMVAGGVVLTGPVITMDTGTVTILLFTGLITVLTQDMAIEHQGLLILRMFQELRPVQENQVTLLQTGLTHREENPSGLPVAQQIALLSAQDQEQAPTGQP